MFFKRHKQEFKNHTDIGSTFQAELDRLMQLPKGTHTNVLLLNKDLKVTDAQSFASIFTSYFLKEEYIFSSSGNKPLIIDGGSNVGISIHYWKHLYPDARIIGFEPDAEAFEALEYNCIGLSEITLIKSALWIKNGITQFSAKGGDGGHLSELSAGVDLLNKVEIDTRRLLDFVEPVEMLKLDIEGAEIDVILDCSDKLFLVNKMFIEYHSFINKPQRLSQFFQVIEQAGFRIHAHPELPAPQPFISRPIYNEKDFRLNVYCFRD